MRWRYLVRIRTWVAVANTAVAIGLGIFVGFAVAVQLFPPTAEPVDETPPAGPVRLLEFAPGNVSGAPAGDAIFVRTPKGATLFTSDGDVLARFEGQIASFAWLRDGSGVLLREGAASATATLPVVVLELDGKVTRLPVDVSEAALLSAGVSPDGKWIAFGTDRVVVADRDGGELRRLTDALSALALLGWDQRGRVLVRDPDGISAYAVGGGREAIALPLALRDAAFERVGGGDPGAVVLRGASALWRTASNALAIVPNECLTLWTRPTELLCVASGRAYAFDVATGQRRSLAAIVDDAVRAGLRACGDDVIIWTDRASAVRALDLVTGVDRVLEGAPPLAQVQALPGARFLASDGKSTYLIDPRAP